MKPVKVNTINLTCGVAALGDESRYIVVVPVGDGMYVSLVDWDVWMHIPFEEGSWISDSALYIRTEALHAVLGAVMNSLPRSGCNSVAMHFDDPNLLLRCGDTTYLVAAEPGHFGEELPKFESGGCVVEPQRFLRFGSMGEIPTLLSPAIVSNMLYGGTGIASWMVGGNLAVWAYSEDYSVEGVQFSARARELDRILRFGAQASLVRSGNRLQVSSGALTFWLEGRAGGESSLEKATAAIDAAKKEAEFPIVVQREMLLWTLDDLAVSVFSPSATMLSWWDGKDALQVEVNYPGRDSRGSVIVLERGEGHRVYSIVDSGVLYWAVGRFLFSDNIAIGRIGNTHLVLRGGNDVVVLKHLVEL